MIVIKSMSFNVLRISISLTPLLIINLSDKAPLPIVLYYSMEELGIIIALFQPRHARPYDSRQKMSSFRCNSTKCFLAFSRAARFCSDGHSS